MNRTTPYRRLLTAPSASPSRWPPWPATPPPRSRELAVGEAAAFLSASEESGDIGAEAVADASSEMLTSMSVEDVDTATEPTTDGPGSATSAPAARRCWRSTTPTRTASWTAPS